MPDGAECCGDGYGFCDSPNHCYKYQGQVRDVCCTDSSCTAYVDNGVTSYRTSSTRAATATRTATTTTFAATTTAVRAQYYYWTVTW